MNTTTQIKQSSRVSGPAGYLYAESYGEGGLPVLFAHSFGGSTRQWEKQSMHLESERRAAAFDFRSHGRSEMDGSNDFAPGALAEDILAVADQLRLDRFVLVGHSMGGLASVAFADAHANRIAGLVLCGTPGKSDSERARTVIASLESDQYEQVMEAYMKRLLDAARPEVYSQVMMEMEKISRETSISVIKAMFAYDPLPALQRYNGPLLIISTVREKDQPNSLAAQMPDSEVELIDGTSHWLQMDKPGEFNVILDEFLQSLQKDNSM